MEKKKIIAIVQARLSSSRLPNKVIEKINSETVTEIIFKRLKCSKLLDDIIFAIPKEESTYKNFLKKKKLNIF